MDVIGQINHELATLSISEQQKVLAYINAIQRSKGQAPPPAKSSGKTLTLKQFRVLHDFCGRRVFLMRMDEVHLAKNPDGFHL